MVTMQIEQGSGIRIALLGTYHPAIPTSRVLMERGWLSVLVLPEEAGYRNEDLRALAEAHRIPWTYSIEDLDQYPLDMLIAANYPRLVPRRFLDSLPCLNTHWSLLPRWRGVHPTAWAMINGDERIGLTVHQMTDEFDAGGILRQKSVQVTAETDFNQLHEELAELQADAVVEVVEAYLRTGELVAQPQDESQATYVPQRVPEDGILHWNWPASRLAGLVRALPLPKYPGAFTFCEGRKLILCSASTVDGPVYFATPGQVVRVLDDGSVWVKAGDTCLAVHEVMFEGDAEPLPASRVLRRGCRLGIDPQREMIHLQRRVSELEAQVRALQENGEDAGK